MTDIRGVEHAVATRAYPGKDHDRTFVSPDGAIFALFDGAGDRYASSLAQLVCEQYCSVDKPPTSLQELFALIQVHLLSTFDGQSMTTGSAIRLIMDSADTLQFEFVHAGDSPIYYFNPLEQQLRRLTQDESTRLSGGIDASNFLGSPDHRLRQLGSLSVAKPCMLVIGSDGITDDHYPGHVTDSTLADILSSSSSATEAANSVLDTSTVPDDASIIIIRAS